MPNICWLIFSSLHNDTYDMIFKLLLINKYLTDLFISLKTLDIQFIHLVHSNVDQRSPDFIHSDVFRVKLSWMGV